MRIYRYRFCKISEIDKLKDFIDRHWKKGHILSKSDVLLKFQHHVEGSDVLTFVVAENLETGEFDGVYGYISNWKYAPSHDIPNIQWGAVWKTRDDIHNNEIGKIGLGMLHYILKNDPSEVFGSLGISNIHKQIASQLGYILGEMNRFYIINFKIKDFNVIQNPDTRGWLQSATDSYIKEIAFPENVYFEDNMNPYKTIEYFKNRYYNHPFFNYRYLGLFHNHTLKGIFVFRKIKANGTFVVRIMDFIGTFAEVNSITNSVQKFLEEEDAEYMDCLNHGIDSRLFFNLGFKQVRKDSDTIIPEYFAPFIQSYVPMEFAYMADSTRPLVIFKADGDQDRPNE